MHFQAIGIFDYMESSWQKKKKKDLGVKNGFGGSMERLEYFC